MADQDYPTGGMQPISPAIVAACDRAAAELEPYTGRDDRVAALYNKIVSIAHPADGKLQKAEQTVTEVYKATRQAADAGKLTAGDRMVVGKATQDAQLEYLRATNPGAAARWEAARDQRERRAAGGR